MVVILIMKRRRMLLRVRFLFLFFSTVFGIYIDNTMRCQLYGISYNDCFGSVYRPISVYDSYVKSFNLPVRKDEICAYSMCKIAILGSGLDKFISIANKAHPPGDCVCVGQSSCGCESIVVSTNSNAIFSIPEITQQQLQQIPEVKTITKIISTTKTVTIKPTLAQREDIVEVQKVPTAALDAALFGSSESTLNSGSTILEELEKKIQMLENKSFLNRKDSKQLQKKEKTQQVHFKNARHQNVANVHQTGNVITIPYSTITETVSVTIPEYKTIVRTQYVVNTVDNYITETQTKTQTKTTVKTKTETAIKTITETISDHVERTKFSTVYIPKTITLDKVSTLIKYTSKTHTITNMAIPSSMPLANTKDSAKPKKMLKVKLNAKLKTPAYMEKSQKSPSKYYLLKKQVLNLNNRSICKDGCTNPNIQLSGECSIISVGACPPIQAQQFIMPSAKDSSSRNILDECVIKNGKVTNIVKTVYVKATPS